MIMVTGGVEKFVKKFKYKLKLKFKYKIHAFMIMITGGVENLSN